MQCKYVFYFRPWNGLSQFSILRLSIFLTENYEVEFRKKCYYSVFIVTFLHMLRVCLLLFLDTVKPLVSKYHPKIF